MTAARYDDRDDDDDDDRDDDDAEVGDESVHVVVVWYESGLVIGHPAKVMME